MKIPQNLPINNLGNITSKISEIESKLKFNLPGGLVFAPTVWQAVAMVALIFLLILTLGQVRRHYAGWHFSGILPGIAFGFILAIILEALLVIGGKSIFTELVGWRSAPKPISNVLDAGQNKLKDTLGVSTSQPALSREEIQKEINKLTLQERLKLVGQICEK